MVTIITKMSIVLHLARKSNHKRIWPRIVTDKLAGGTNQSDNVNRVLAYGHANENKKIKTASSCPPAIRAIKSKLS